MKPPKLIPITLFIFTAITVITPVTAQSTNHSGESPSSANHQKAIVPIDEQTLRIACSGKRFDLLPIPFSDVPPDHWAFEAVMNLYYCIGLPAKF